MLTSIPKLSIGKWTPGKISVVGILGTGENGGAGEEGGIGGDGPTWFKIDPLFASRVRADEPGAAVTEAKSANIDKHSLPFVATSGFTEKDSFLF